MQDEMEDMLDMAGDVQEAMSRSYGMPDVPSPFPSLLPFPSSKDWAGLAGRLTSPSWRRSWRRWATSWSWTRTRPTWTTPSPPPASPPPTPPTPPKTAASKWTSLASPRSPPSEAHCSRLALSPRPILVFV